MKLFSPLHLRKRAINRRVTSAIANSPVDRSAASTSSDRMDTRFVSAQQARLTSGVRGSPRSRSLLSPQRQGIDGNSEGDLTAALGRRFTLTAFQRDRFADPTATRLVRLGRP